MKPLLLVFILISTSFIHINTTRRHLSDEVQLNLKRVSEICNQLKKDVKDGKIDYILQFEEYVDFFKIDPKKVENLVNPYYRIKDLKQELNNNSALEPNKKYEIIDEIKRLEDKVNTYFASTDLAFGTYALCLKMLHREMRNTELLNSIDLNNPAEALKTVLKIKIERSTGVRR